MVTITTREELKDLELFQLRKLLNLICKETNMMTHTELKQVILEYMRDLYKMEYIGGLDIESLDPVGYKVSFNFDRSEMPLVIIADLPDEEFLPFIKEELRSRKLQRVKYYNATKLPPEQHNLCYEREGIDRQDKRGYCGTCI
nr:MAG: hypothetical protein [Bacteriophage sp.]